MERQVPDLQIVISYDVLGEMNASNFLARRSLEDMRATAGQFQDHHVMLQAALDGATPSEGPLNRRFNTGNREQLNTVEYVVGQAMQMCGRLETKIEQLSEKHWDLLGRGLQDVADQVESEKEKYEEFARMYSNEKRPSR